MNGAIVSTITVEANHDWTDWDRFVRTSLTGTVYHSSGWLRALWHGMGHDIRVHCLIVEDNIRLGVVVRRGYRFGLFAAKKPWATAYNGLVGYENVQGPLQDYFLRSIASRYLATRLVQAPAVDQRPCVPWTWELSERFTPVLSISDLGQTWNRFDRRVRQRVRKAGFLGVSVEESTEFGVFASLYRMSYSRQRVELHIGESEVAHTLKSAHGAGVLRLFLARSQEGAPAAGLVVGQDRHRAYFMLAGADPESRTSDAMTLLWWRVMELLAPTCDEVDLVGMATPGVDRFKRSFAPIYRPLVELNSVSLSGLPLPAKSLYAVTRWARKISKQVTRK